MLPDVIARVVFQAIDEVSAPVARMTAQVKASEAEMTAAAKGGAAAQTAAYTSVATKTREVGAAHDLTQNQVLGTARAFSTISIGAGIAGLAMGAYGLKVATSMSDVEAHVLAGTNTTRAQLKLVEDQTISLSLATGKSAPEIMGAYYNIASSVSNAAKARTILANAVKFGTAFDTDSTTATGLLTGVVNAYHLSLKDIPKAQDDLTQAVKIGAAEARDLAPALSQVVPIAARLGVSVKDLGAMFAVETNQGLSAAEAGTYIGNMLTQMLAPTNQQIRAVTALGGSYEDLRVHHGNVQATLQKLNDLMHASAPTAQDLADKFHLSATRAQIFADQLSNADGRARLLFGGNIEAAKSFFELMGNGGKQTADAFRQMANDAGVTERSFKTAMTSAQKEFDKTRAAVELLALQIGRALLPQVQALAKDVIPAATGLASLSKDHQTISSGLFDVAAALTAAGLAARGGSAAWKLWTDGATAATAATKGVVAGLVALGVAGSVILTGTIVATALAWRQQAKDEANVKSGLIELNQRYREGKISYDDYRDAMVRATEVMKGPLAAAIERATLDHQHEKGQIDAVTQSWHTALQARIDYENAASGRGGPGAPTSLPGFGGGTSTPQTIDLQKQIADITKQIQVQADIVAFDLKNHSASLRTDQAELDRLKARAAALSAEELSLTTTTKAHTAATSAGARALSVHNIKIDALAAAQQKLSEAENAAYRDIAAGHPVTAAHTAAIRADYVEVQKMTAAVTNITNPIRNLAAPVSAATASLNFFQTAVSAATTSARTKGQQDVKDAIQNAKNAATADKLNDAVQKAAQSALALVDPPLTAAQNLKELAAVALAVSNALAAAAAQQIAAWSASLPFLNSGQTIGSSATVGGNTFGLTTAGLNAYQQAQAAAAAGQPLTPMQAAALAGGPAATPSGDTFFGGVVLPGLPQAPLPGGPASAGTAPSGITNPSGSLSFAGVTASTAASAAASSGGSSSALTATVANPIVSALQSLQSTVQQGNQQQLAIAQQQLQAANSQIAAQQEQIDRLTGLLNISTQGLQFQMGWVGPAAVNQLGTAGIANRGH